ncbi:MAG: hypothetical protein RJA29_2218 [Pseudomonadota bacterium]
MLGATSESARAIESQKLLNWGFTAYDAVKLFDGNQAILTPPVWKSRQSTMPIGRPDPIVVAIPAGQLARLKTEVARPDPLVAPFQRGQTVAQLKLTLGDQPLPDIPLVSLQQVEQAGVIGRAWDAVRLWIK